MLSGKIMLSKGFVGKPVDKAGKSLGLLVICFDVIRSKQFLAAVSGHLKPMGKVIARLFFGQSGYIKFTHNGPVGHLFGQGCQFVLDAWFAEQYDPFKLFGDPGCADLVKKKLKFL